MDWMKKNIWMNRILTYPKCVDDTIGNDALGWMNLGGVDLKSFSIKSRSDANEFNNCKTKSRKNMFKNIFAVKSHVFIKVWFLVLIFLKKG